MSLHEITFINKRLIAENTVELTFEKPNDFNYQAGQFASFTLLNPKQLDPISNMREFSLESSPHETVLRIAFRLSDRSVFKLQLAGLQLGDTVRIDGPYGDYVLNYVDQNQSLVFLVGGIGITPVMSILRDLTVGDRQLQVALIHSDQTESSSPYLAEARQLIGKLPNAQLKSIFTRTSAPRKQRIDQSFIDQLVQKNDNAHYYVSGSVAMVRAAKRYLIAAGVDERSIWTEEFGGY